MLRLQENGKTSTQPELDEPLPVHAHCIFAQSKEEEDQKATSEVDPAIIHHRGRKDNARVPGSGIVNGGEGECRGTRDRCLDDEDVDLKGSRAGEKNKGDDEEAEKA